MESVGEGGLRGLEEPLRGLEDPLGGLRGLEDPEEKPLLDEGLDVLGWRMMVTSSSIAGERTCVARLCEWDIYLFRGFNMCNKAYLLI